MLTNSIVAKTINKPIHEPLERYLKRYPFPFFVEPKYDGERVFLEVSDTITIANKHKTVYPERILPQTLVSAIREAVKEGLYDAEFYSSRGNLYKFLSARARLSEDLALAIWDIIDFKNLKLIDRKQLLSNFITSNERVCIVRHTICHSRFEIIEAFNKAVSEGFEGVVVKPNSGYYARWLKIKTQYTADMVVLAIKKTDSWRKDRIPYTFLMGVYENGSFNRIGDVSSGLTLKEKQGIGEFVSELRQRENNEYVFLKPEIVLEIEYHQKTENGLREPKIKRIRFDKNPKDCVRNPKQAILLKQVKKLREKYITIDGSDEEFIEWWRRNHGTGYPIKIVEDYPYNLSLF